MTERLDMISLRSEAVISTTGDKEDEVVKPIVEGELIVRFDDVSKFLADDSLWDEGLVLQLQPMLTDEKEDDVGDDDDTGLGVDCDRISLSCSQDEPWDCEDNAAINKDRIDCFQSFSISCRQAWEHMMIAMKFKWFGKLKEIERL